LAGAMKATMANAIRTIDALRAKKEAGEPAAPAAVVEAPVAEAAPVVEAPAAEAVVEEVAEVSTPAEEAAPAAESTEESPN